MGGEVECAPTTPTTSPPLLTGATPCASANAFHPCSVYSCLSLLRRRSTAHSHAHAGSAAETSSKSVSTRWARWAVIKAEGRVSLNEGATDVVGTFWGGWEGEGTWWGGKRSGSDERRGRRAAGGALSRLPVRRVASPTS
jgi:hypothetical protein